MGASHGHHSQRCTTDVSPKLQVTATSQEIFGGDFFQIVTRNQPFKEAIVPLRKFRSADLSDFYEWSDEKFFGGFTCFVYDTTDIPAGVAVNLATLDPPLPDNQFSVGMLVEAVDRKLDILIGVASIYAVSGGYVFVMFDGLDQAFSYWCHHASPEIRPAGTCSLIGLKLASPSTRDGRAYTWMRVRGNWRHYASEIGAALAPAEAFGSLVRPERSDDVLSLQELCLRQFVSGLREDVLEMLGSEDNPVLSHLPLSVCQQLRQARCCGWCGKAFLTGYKCVEAFTTQAWLTDPKLCHGRTTTTCSHACGEALVSRSRMSNTNLDDFLHPRLFAVPPTYLKKHRRSN